MDGLHGPRAAELGRSAWAGVLVGVGVVAAVDEIVFHQLLRWHHFYDRSTSGMGLVSDGLLHAGSLIALVAGFFLFADLNRRGVASRRSVLGGFLAGAGGFQVWDSFIHHKLLRLHQIRYDVDVLVYDVVWTVGGFLVLAVGVVLVWRARADDAHGGRGRGRDQAPAVGSDSDSDSDGPR